MRKGLAEFTRICREWSLPLIVGIVAALVWANVDHASYERLLDGGIWGVSLELFVNDGFMALFFGMAAVEITANLSPGGSLHPLKKAINPLMGTVGGVVGPVGCFFLLNLLMGGKELTNGWGIPTATDIAIAWMAARLIFGKGHPAVTYLLLLAVADDAISLAIIAVFYPSPEHPVVPAWLGLVAGGMVVAFVLRRMKVGRYWPYLLVGGVLSWVGLWKAHLHPALALVFIVPFLPEGGEKGGVAEEYAIPGKHHSPLLKFEHDWKGVVDFGLVLFGFCNAGVAFGAIGRVTWIVWLSLLVGKTVGISAFAMGAAKCGFSLDRELKFRQLLVLGMIGGIGLTVALFVANVAYGEAALRDGAKMGALFSAVNGVLAWAAARVLGIRKRVG